MIEFMAITPPYLIPRATVSFEQEIKRSRFITYLAHTPSTKKAKAFVQQMKDTHPQARHHCWGFVAGAPSDSMQLGFSDDGEPSGTAGKPILAQLQGSNIGEICAVVIRYSGGIKLGTGGLVKAYGGGVKHALLFVKTKTRVAMERIVLEYNYALQSVIDDLIHEFSLFVEASDFGEKAKISASLEAIHLASLLHKVSLYDADKLTAQRFPLSD
jgi:uncharacterized YigZ family protein